MTDGPWLLAAVVAASVAMACEPGREEEEERESPRASASDAGALAAGTGGERAAPATTSGGPGDAGAERPQPADAGITSAMSAAPDPSELQLVEATLTHLRAALATRLVAPAELAEMYLARVRAYDEVGPSVNAFLHVSTNASRDASALGSRCERADAPPLCGIPVILKDNIDTADMPTTAGSLALAGSVPARDAFVTRRLREAGAVILGKATLTEFAAFLSTSMPSGYSSLGGFGFNPYDPRALPGGDGRPVLTPGGSSSGSGIAVSANLAAVAIGTETAGSIISPASSNGIVGIKPTLGLISRSGIIPISADQDTAGPLARTVADAALLLGVLAGFDPEDPATSACLEPGRCESDYTRFLDAGALAGARIAVPPFPMNRATVMEAALETLEEAGAEVVRLPALPVQRGPCLAVPAANNCSMVLLYGFKRDLNTYLANTPAAPVGSLAEIIAANAVTDGALAFGQQLAVAANALDIAPDSADTARYQSDLANARASARAALDAVYGGADGTPDTEDDFDALLFSENSGAGTPAVAGYPSVCVPGGLVAPTGAVQNPFPSGVTFSGPAFSEARLLALAYSFERATNHRAAPASTPPLPGDLVRR